MYEYLPSFENEQWEHFSEKGVIEIQVKNYLRNLGQNLMVFQNFCCMRKRIFVDVRKKIFICWMREYRN